MDTEKLKDFLQELDCELTSDELAVISCLREHLIEYMPNYINPEQSVNSEINRVIDNYRLMAFEEAKELLTLYTISNMHITYELLKLIKRVEKLEKDNN